MTPYSPWESPPNTGSLEQGDLASFEINEIEPPEDSSEDEAEDESEKKAPMMAAMAVLNQQSQIINKLLDMLSSKKL